MLFKGKVDHPYIRIIIFYFYSNKWHSINIGKLLQIESSHSLFDLESDILIFLSYFGIFSYIY